MTASTWETIDETVRQSLAESAAMAPRAISIRIDRYRRTATVVVTGDADVQLAHELSATCNRVTSYNVIVDVAGVSFFGISALRAIAAAAKSGELRGNSLAVVGGSRTTQRLFHLSDIARLLREPCSSNDV